MKAIETLYNGYRFRSRLEARWAVFFDSIGIEYQYEPEGFDLNGIWYLPDFWMPSKNYWIEIKPTVEAMLQDSIKIELFGNFLDTPTECFVNGMEYSRFFVFVGSAYLDDYKIYYHMGDNTLTPQFELAWIHCPLCNNISISYYTLDFCPVDGTSSVYCEYCDSFGARFTETDETWFWKGQVETKKKEFILKSPTLLKGYRAARQARFEHGRNGNK